MHFFIKNVSVFLLYSISVMRTLVPHNSIVVSASSSNQHYYIEREYVYDATSAELVEESVNVWVDNSCKVNCSVESGKKEETNTTVELETTMITNTGFSYLVFSVKDKSVKKNGTEFCGEGDDALSTCEVRVRSVLLSPRIKRSTHFF